MLSCAGVQSETLELAVPGTGYAYRDTSTIVVRRKLKLECAILYAYQGTRVQVPGTGTGSEYDCTIVQSYTIVHVQLYRFV